MYPEIRQFVMDTMREHSMSLQIQRAGIKYIEKVIEYVDNFQDLKEQLLDAKMDQVFTCCIPFIS